jgi:hypothetical protein
VRGGRVACGGGREEMRGKWVSKRQGGSASPSSGKRPSRDLRVFWCRSIETDSLDRAVAAQPTCGGGRQAIMGRGNGLKMFRIFLYFYSNLQIYTTILKFIKTIAPPPWVTAATRPTAVAHGGRATANGRVLAVGPRQITVVRHMLSPLATAVGTNRSGGR